jgi:hypothetical protein
VLSGFFAAYRDKRFSVAEPENATADGIGPYPIAEETTFFASVKAPEMPG